MILSIDLETRSPADLKRSGPYVYFEHPYTEILCAAWAIDDGPVQVWTPGQSCPPAIVDIVENGGEISGWNVNFERQGWNKVLGPRHSWPIPHIDQYRDTAAQAAAQTLPRRLEACADVLRLPVRKDGDGHDLMLRMARPRQRRDGEAIKPVYWYEGDLDRLIDYCRMDVIVERAIRNKLQPLSDEELTLWRFDQLINDRGITIDRELVAAMRDIADQHVVALDRKMRDVTYGAVQHCTQTDRLKKWLRIQTQGNIEINSLARSVIDDVLRQIRSMAFYEAEEAVLLWQKASRASVRKLQAADLCANGDSRARGLLRFHGASTGRWAGQLLQPQNMVRGSGLVVNQDLGVRMIMHRSAQILDFCWGDPLAVISDCLRGIMTAGPDRELLAGDYRNIEARITAWLSGNVDKMNAFKRQDDHPDDKHYEVYTLGAAAIYNCDVTAIDSRKRQVGKTAELALGFGGGVDALANMAATYRIDMADALPALWEAASDREKTTVTSAYDDMVEKGNDRDLSPEAWLACKLAVRAWRRANKPTVAMWDTFHSAAWHALEDRDPHIAGRIIFQRHGGFLWMTLPSGRRLAYPTPAVENRPVPWSDKRLPIDEQEHRDMLTVLSFLPSGHKERYAFYPGLTFQHAVQAIARDILAHGMVTVEAAGYPVIMSIHDEIICELDRGHGDLGKFLQKLCQLPPWARDLPLLADGWKGFRYRKV